ncbi:LOW QUALITY PROTEIN: UPF0587 protein CG4646-like [Pyrus x bretschneideri]|uniref:LOW QUALITY PROTEIN: UPF0587 protein CG4646-like n=1 Tax=Pyrus x bretschneideri TaxID=225117 RepID=UPI00202F7A19|nr:LOW QUALITY PROTEIN: UPF0587 protein CG4646-like [Pyrus x bretschneideri]
MVKFLLQISAELKNLTYLQPQDGCDDPDYSYLFKLRCEWCGELSLRETRVSLNETVPLPARNKRTANVIRKRTAKVIHRRTANVIQKCKLCERVGMILMHPGLGKPLTQAASDARQFAPMMIFYFRGFVPVDFVFVGGWRAESPNGINFEHIDLSAGKFVEYDVEYPVMISNLLAACGWVFYAA